MPRSRRLEHLDFPIFFIILFCGCLAKAAPSPPAGFVNFAVMSEGADLPFQRAWRKSGMPWKKKTKIYIAPVKTDYLLRMTWWEETGRGIAIQSDIKDLGRFTQQALVDAFRNDPGPYFQVVSQPGPDVIQLEFALTELVPSKAELKAAGLIPPLWIPSMALGLTTRSHVAFEARVTDAESGEVLAQFADSEQAKAAVFNVKDFTWYSHARSVIREWAGQMVVVLKKNSGDVVEDSSVFTWKFW